MAAAAGGALWPLPHPACPIEPDVGEGLVALLGLRRFSSPLSPAADNDTLAARSLMEEGKDAVAKSSIQEYRKVAAGQQSRYRGVFPNGRKWTAQMHKSGFGKKIYLGNYAKEEDAGRAVIRGEQLLALGWSVEQIVADLRPPPADRSRFSSKHKGVSWCSHGKKWRCAFRHGGRVVVWGYFDDEDAAGHATLFAKSALERGETVEAVKAAVKAKRLKIDGETPPPPPPPPPDLAAATE